MHEPFCAGVGSLCSGILPVLHYYPFGVSAACGQSTLNIGSTMRSIIPKPLHPIYYSLTLQNSSLLRVVYFSKRAY
jgi:hypothetical protein